MRLSLREIVLFFATGTVVLIGGALLLAKPVFKEMKETRTKMATLRSTIEYDKQLVAQDDLWASRIEELSKLLPHHPKGKNVGVYWLSTMNRIASRHGVRILKHQLGEESMEGDVCELPIDCKEWEGELKAVVHFLFDLQKDGAMLDIQQLTMKPKGRNLLRGRFVLLCAYTRDEE